MAGGIRRRLLKQTSRSSLVEVYNTFSSWMSMPDVIDELTRTEELVSELSDALDGSPLSRARVGANGGQWIIVQQFKTKRPLTQDELDQHYIRGKGKKMQSIRDKW